MKKRMSLLTVVFAVVGLIAMALPAAAADLHEPHTGGVYSCGYGYYHFVNNQTDGAEWTGTITAVFSGGTETVASGKVLRNVQHFYVYGYGALIDASTNLPGRLVLSDYECLCPCVCVS